MVSFDGSLYEPIALYPDLKFISLINIIFNVYQTFIAFDDQETFFGNVRYFYLTDEYTEDIYDMIFKFHHLNLDK